MRGDVAQRQRGRAPVRRKRRSRRGDCARGDVYKRQPQTTAEGSTLAGVYNSGGINSLVQMTETATGIKPDFYIVMTVTDFASFFDDLGEVNYPLAADVKYRNTTAADPFSLRISAGEASLNGKRFTALWRYFLEEKDLKSANDLGLAALNMLFSADNGTEKDELFRNFVTLARTNPVSYTHLEPRRGRRLLAIKCPNSVHILPLIRQGAFATAQLVHAAIKRSTGAFSRSPAAPARGASFEPRRGRQLLAIKCPDSARILHFFQ